VYFDVVNNMVLCRESGVVLGILPRRLREGGQVLILVALLLPVMLGTLGLGTDLGIGMAARRAAQDAVDGASYGGTMLLNNNAGLGPYTMRDVYNVINDTIQQASFVPHTVHLYNPSGGSAANASGTVDVWAQFIDGSGGTYGYLTNSSDPLPSGATGVRVHDSWPQRTYFGAAVGWQQYSVAATAAYAVEEKTVPGLNVPPFTVWWDPPYGSCNTGASPCTTDAAYNLAAVDGGSGVVGSKLCEVDNGSLPCLMYGPGPTTTNAACYPVAGGNNHPAAYQDPCNSHSIQPGTVVVFYSGQFANDAGIRNGLIGNPPFPGNIDPDFDPQNAPNDFKGYWGGTGSQASCPGQPIDLNGNGNTGNNAQSAITNTLLTTKDGSGNTIYWGYFAVFDKAYKSGDFFLIPYDYVPLQIDPTQFAGNSNGPWYGTVMAASPTLPPSIINPNCTNGWTIKTVALIQ
jgi:hypothetical protein